jgi:CheY-like chemotaxis protein/HPt (histidine-containing phosphotransfer) domain-containing protein
MRMVAGSNSRQVKVPSRQDDLEHAVTPQLKILIADDDAQSQKMMEFILRRTGHDVNFASNGVDAVQMVKSGGFDLVLMDVQMPIMDGLDATRQIREWENEGDRLVIVGLTAILDSEHGKCRQAGMDGIISKPFDVEEFQAVITACVNQKEIDVKKTGSADSTGLSILDVQGAVKRFAGDEENYASLLDEFISSLSGKLEELMNDYKAGNWHVLSNHAHNLKGLSANFGAMELSRNALELDQYVNESQYEQAKHKLAEMDVCIQNLRTEASAFLRSYFNDKDNPV